MCLEELSGEETPDGTGNQLTAVTGAALTDTLSYDADGALVTRKKERSMGNNNYLGVDKETFGYNYAGVVRRYEKSSNYKTLGSCSEPAEETPIIWRYRYNAGAERELKWLQSADLLPDFSKNWVYYQLGADKRQHGVYNGRETVAPDLCSNMNNRVLWFPTEYLTYGLGGTPLVSYKPFVEDGETYYIADHLGNTRVTLSSNGNVVSSKDFEPFGKELHSNGSDRLTFIGKEKDSESDLGDFGVRKYEAEYGRFLSVDRLWEKGRTVHGYQYGHNNPLNRHDPSGLWDPEIHAKILRTALESYMSSKQIEIIVNAADGIDKCSDCQGTEKSYTHAMRAPGQTPEEAETKMNEFIDGKKDIFAFTSDETEALKAFGEASHPVMDATSPSHEGFQQWDGLTLTNPITWLKGIIHISKESDISNEQFSKVVKKVEQLYLDFVEYKRATQEVSNRLKELEKTEIEEKQKGAKK